LHRNLFDITTLDDRAEGISNLLESDSGDVLSANSRNITITNGVFGADNIKAKLSALSCSRRDTNMGLRKPTVSVCSSRSFLAVVRTKLTMYPVNTTFNPLVPLR